MQFEISVHSCYNTGYENLFFKKVDVNICLQEEIDMKKNKTEYKIASVLIILSLGALYCTDYIPETFKLQWIIISSAFFIAGMTLIFN